MSKQYQVIREEKMGERQPIPRGFDWVLALIRIFQLYQMAQKLHANDKEIRGKGIPLPNASRRLKRLQAAPIKEKGGGD